MSADLAPLLPFLVRDAEGAEVDEAGEVVAAAYLADGLASAGYAARLRASRERSAMARLVVAVDAAGHVLGTVTYARSGSPLAELCRSDAQGGPAAEIRMLGVRPDARGAGVAEALVRWCLTTARTESARRVLLSTQVEMRAAQRLPAARVHPASGPGLGAGARRPAAGDAAGPAGGSGTLSPAQTAVCRKVRR